MRGLFSRPERPWHQLEVDLHSHSRVSDGTLAPAAVVARAHAAGVRLHALTDHDETGGIAEAAAEAGRLGMAFVAGVEISVSWAGETIHVVGLRISAEDPALGTGLARTRAGRDERAREIGRQLERAGVPRAYEGALRHVGNPALISRMHFARHIIDTGLCANTGEVFSRYLSAGRPGYVAHRWAELDEAVGWIRAAGGVAVLAHPGRYRLDEGGLWALMTEFRDVGGTAIEVVSGSHRPDQYRRFADFAREFGFLASRGTDFHSPGESRVDFGVLPPLPDSVEPVWRDWPEAAGLLADSGAPAAGHAGLARSRA
ncbi:MAG: 3',5'-nucleoside bisphosphate phosphatase [Burkholderiaceae bacterium]